MKKIKTIEMFAGVGGFRVGLSKAGGFDFVWANQWEPGKKRQAAWECYEKNFGAGSCLNKDVSLVDCNEIPDFDLLTAGFPCQDYSIAKTLNNSSGIEGKKGVLWWDIVRVLKAKLPAFVLLENVDRLLLSPAKQRGRDFAMILSSLMGLGYSAEWRVVNAGNFGMPQKRKRVFIFAWQKVEAPFVLGRAFDFKTKNERIGNLSDNLLELSDTFFNNGFFNYGIATDFSVNEMNVVDVFDGKKVGLGDIVLPLDEVDKSFLISRKELKDWEVFKLGRQFERVSRGGHKYWYREGKMTFPDKLEEPSRTIITAEGGKTPSRFKHVILQDGVYRRLMPVELERLNMFPDHHTDGFTDVQRAFFMGNALVTGVVEKIGSCLKSIV